MSIINDKVWAFPKAIKGDKGDKGDSIKGDKGDRGDDGKSLTFRHSWNRTIDYHEYDVILFDGSSFVAIADNKSRRPDIARDVWQLLASKGQRGLKGEQGGAVVVSSGTAGLRGELYELQGQLASLKSRETFRAIIDTDAPAGAAVRIINGVSVTIADASTVSGASVAGLVVAPAAANQLATIQTGGILEIQGWGLQPGELYWLSTVPGELTPLSPDVGGVSALLGRAITADKFLIEIQQGVLL